LLKKFRGLKKVFIKVVKKRDVTRGDRDSGEPVKPIETVEKTVDYVNLAVAIGFLLIILAAAFYAQGMEKPWVTASEALLTAFTGGAGLVIGALLGESTGATTTPEK
jgi:hypothetical protein